MAREAMQGHPWLYMERSFVRLRIHLKRTSEKDIGVMSYV